MTRFRPCIDLHDGQVKQIIGGTLGSATTELHTNFVSSFPPAYFARLYQKHGLTGAHVIMLGPGNDEAAKEALRGWPGGLQIGGGINDQNARDWIEVGADKVIVTSFLFPGGNFSPDRLQTILKALDGNKDKLVIDLSCRRHGNGDVWFIAMDKWQTITNMELDQVFIGLLEPYCSEFLVHAADGEGLQQGIDEQLVARLGEWCSIPVTYAGGARHIEDLELVEKLSGGRVDLTIGSALDCFGGHGVKLADCIAWNERRTGTNDAASRQCQGI